MIDNVGTLLRLIATISSKSRLGVLKTTLGVLRSKYFIFWLFAVSSVIGFIEAFIQLAWLHCPSPAAGKTLKLIRETLCWSKVTIILATCCIRH